MCICVEGITYAPFTYHCKKVFVYGVQTQEYTNGLLFYRVIACISPAVTKCRTAKKNSKWIWTKIRRKQEIMA